MQCYVILNEKNDSDKYKFMALAAVAVYLKEIKSYSLAELCSAARHKDTKGHKVYGYWVLSGSLCLCGINPVSNYAFKLSHHLERVIPNGIDFLFLPT